MVPLGAEKLEQLEATLEKNQEAGAARGVTQNEMMEKLGQAIQAIGSKMETFEEKFGYGLQDLGRAMDRSQALLEAKVEHVFTSQSKQHREDAQNDMTSALNKFAEKSLQHTEATQAANVSSQQSIENTLKQVTEKLDELQTSQHSVLARLGGSITEMTDGWANQIIQESKANAFTLQAKLVLMEEAQHKKQVDANQRMMDNLGKTVTDCQEKLEKLVSHESQMSREKFQASIEFAKSGSSGDYGMLEKKMADMAKDISQESCKQVEAGLGVFSNSLRSQLDNMQAGVQGGCKESERNVCVKIESLANKLATVQQQSVKQVETMSSMEGKITETSMTVNQFPKHLEHAMRAQSHALERPLDVAMQVMVDSAQMGRVPSNGQLDVAMGGEFVNNGVRPQSAANYNSQSRGGGESVGRGGGDSVGRGVSAGRRNPGGGVPSGPQSRYGNAVMHG